MPVILGYKYLSTYNPYADWISYTVQIAFSTGSEVCLTGVRPRCLEPIVELCSAKAAVHELQRGAIAWFLLLKML